MKKRVPLGEAGETGLGSPFAALLKGIAVPAAAEPPKQDANARNEATAGASAAPAAGQAQGSAAPASGLDASLRRLSKLVVRRERKGRGGKTVTLVEGLAGLEDAEVAVLLTRLRKGLGCGAGQEGSETGSGQGPVIVLQGDQVERAEAILLTLGVKRVVRGS